MTIIIMAQTSMGTSGEVVMVVIGAGIIMILAIADSRAEVLGEDFVGEGAEVDLVTAAEGAATEGVGVVMADNSQTTEYYELEDF